MKSKSLFVKLLLSFILLIIVPIILLSIFSVSNIETLYKNEASKASIDKLKVMQESIEVFLKETSNNALGVSINVNLDKLNKIGENISTRNIEHVNIIRDILELLYNLEKSNSKVYSVYLYHEYTGQILTSKMETYFVDNFYDTSWIEYYRQNRQSISWLGTRVPFNNNNKDIYTNQPEVITLVYPLSSFVTQMKGAIAVNIFEDEIYKIINRSEPEESITGVVDINGQVISSNDVSMERSNISQSPYFNKIIETDKSMGYLDTVINNKKCLVSYIKSKYNHWIFISISPFEKLLLGVGHFKALILYCSLIFVIVGIAISYFISKKLYNPVRSLVEEIKSQKGIDIKDNSSNELFIIKNAFNDVLKEGNKLHEIFEKNKNNLRDSYLIKVLSGNEDIEADDGLAGVAYPNKFFSTIILSIDNHANFVNRNSITRQYYIKSLIIKICENIFASISHCTGLQFENDQIVLVVNANFHKIESYRIMLLEQIDNIKAELNKLFDFSFTFALGNPYEGISSLKVSFGEARWALKYKVIYRYGSIIPIWEVISREEHAKDYFYPYTKEKHLFNFLKLNMQKEVVKAVEDFVAEVELWELSYDNTMQIYFQLISNIIKYLLDIKVNPMNVFESSTTLYYQLQKMDSIDLITNWLKNICTCIIEYCELRNSNNRKYITKAIEYINDNYHKDIDISTISDVTGISYVHLRRIFKEELGDNINNYVNKLRIEESKKCLKFTKDTIPEIAAKVGYNNNQSFNRFFKKYEGITPGEYRMI